MLGLRRPRPTASVSPVALRLLIQRGLSTGASRAPLQIVIVGSGPAGFYTAHRLLKNHAQARVDVFERLPAPFGLVRYGVAPDHPEVKNVAHKFAEVAQTAEAAGAGAAPPPRCRLLANVTVGRDVSLGELRAHYDAVVLAYGTAGDAQLGVPGEATLRNVAAARAFVGWYNAHPECTNPPVDLTAGDTALVFGQGNVALDVARVLLSPVDALRGTDIPDAVLAELARSRVRRVRLVGRRGPLQAAFTAKELREMLALPDTALRMDAALFRAELAHNAAALKADRARSRLMGILDKHLAAAEKAGASAATPEISAKEWHLDFLWSPVALLDDGHGAVRGAEVAINELQTDARSGRLRAVPTGDTEVLEGSVVIKSIGYRAEPLADHPFDQATHTVPHDRGRVLQRYPEGDPEAAPTAVPPAHEPGMYVAGWLKRGPSGVIASTMYDAYETADMMLQDVDNGRLVPKSGSGNPAGASTDIAELLRARGVQIVDWEGWLRIERAEAADRGRKIADLQTMLDLALGRRSLFRTKLHG